MFSLIQQKDLGLPRTSPVGPAMNFSLLTELACSIPFRGFAIKYVVEGLERYTVNGTRFAIGQGQYLLANASYEGHVVVDSATPVQGLCIDLTAEVMDAVALWTVQPEAHDVVETGSFFTGPEFLENSYHAQNTELGRVIGPFAQRVAYAPHDPHLIDPSFYFTLAELVVKDHLPLIPRLRASPGVRSGTRNDIFRRVERARQKMHDQPERSLSIAELAAEARMSEYHFFRAFRSIHGTTPHQYLLARRLRNAQEMLATGANSVSDAALLCGFADVHTFSKAFKKRFGYPPSNERTRRF